ncbi:MAG: hypothetical protein CVT97_03800 [Bacteroidetes bacterium HGW-Bacteroidetes-14]|jgi:LruC domain-containing protein|nr:MAG: hypothetical protein CVT97_03800 [Bacteroidetes bacterium HGW-Bacteroidetes-14]
MTIRSKKPNYLIVAILSLLVVTSCIKFPQPDPGVVSDIPESFDWKTVQSVNVNVQVNSINGISDNYIRVIKVYSSPMLKDGSLLSSGAAKPGTPFNVNLTLPTSLQSLYIQEILPDGSRTLTKTDITSKSISINTASGITKSSSNAAQNAAFTSPSVPVPANFDVIISNNNSVSVVGFTAGQSSAYGNQYKSYLIPAGVTRTANIDMGNYISHAILYVKGTLKMTGNMGLNKSTIVVLDGGNVEVGGLSCGVFEADLPVFYVEPSGSFYSSKLVNFSDGSDMVNKGTFTVNHNIDVNSSSTLYNEGDIIVSKRGYGLLVSNNSKLYNSGSIDVKKFEITVSASTVNDLGGIIKTETYYQSNGTVVNNHGEIIATTSFKTSGGGIINNFCNITASLTDLQGSVSNLYDGSLWETLTSKFNTCDINMYGGSIFLTGNISAVWDLSLASPSETYSLFKATDNVPDLRYAGSHISGRIEFVHTNLTEGSGTNGRQLYEGLFTDGLALLSKNQTKNILASTCNNAAGQIVAPPPAIVDNDADGVAEALDYDDNDASVAFVSYFPSESTWGTYAFEDTWSWKGDYDMNDLVLSFRITYFTNSLNKVTKMKFDHKILASGSGIQIASAFQLDNIASSSIASVSGQELAGTSPFSVTANGTELGVSKAVIPIFNNVRDVVTDDFGILLNTVDGIYFNTPSGSLTIQFTSPQETSNVSMDAFNFFIVPYKSDNVSRSKEIHLPTFLPTTKIDATLLTGDQLNYSDKYKYSDGMMWGIMIPEKFDYPKEYESIGNAYINFFRWATSGGVEFTDWYKDLDGYRDNSKIYNN